MGSSKHKGHIPNTSLRRVVHQLITGNYPAISKLQPKRKSWWWWKWLYHDDESDCINADDINDDEQDAHSSIDGDAEDSDE